MHKRLCEFIVIFPVESGLIAWKQYVTSIVIDLFLVKLPSVIGS